MNAEVCPYPLVEHRVEAPEPPGVWPRTRTVVLLECPDPSCDGDPESHGARLPCAWSWPFAHGKTHNGESFPRRKCPHCQHIRRAGIPAADVADDGDGKVRYG
jgi:hypothetical protein